MGDAGQRGFLPTRLAIDTTAFVAPGAVVVGEVSLGAEASVWYGCVVRGDIAPIAIGRRTNVQDLTIVHVDHGCPTTIGEGVTIGHRCIVHGCVLEDGCLVGMGSTVLSGARVGSGALVAAGSVVREGFIVPPRTLCAGVPARLVRDVDETMAARIARNAETYVACARAYREGRVGGGPHDGL